MRINIIPVKCLSDIHLRAEYREIDMSVHYYKRTKESEKGIDRKKISKTYTLNTGHAYFFYDKFKFVINRVKELEKEMKIRGFKTNNKSKNIKDLINQYIEEKDINDYKITKDDIKINIERILNKIKIKEFGFYKLNGKSLTYEEWSEIYSKL